MTVPQAFSFLSELDSFEEYWSNAGWGKSKFTVVHMENNAIINK